LALVLIQQILALSNQSKLLISSPLVKVVSQTLLVATLAILTIILLWTTAPHS
jgi:nitrous oxidase accessory protein NosD